MRRWLGSQREQAEDAVQDAALGALSACAAQAPDDPLAYLARAACNRARDGLRARKTRAEVPLDSAAGLAAAAADPERAVAARQDLQRLEAALAALPVRQREALLLHRLDGLSHEAVAARLGCAPATAMVHLSRGLAALRRRLADG